MDNVIIVTTKWDILADDAVSDNLDRYENWTRDAALEPLVSHGAPTLHHGLVQDASGWRKISLRNQRDKSTKHARAMIFDHYATSSNVVLQFYHEIDQGHSVEAPWAKKISWNEAFITSSTKQSVKLFI